MKTYHKTIYMPKHGLFLKTFALQYSLHALEAITDDRYGQIMPLRKITISAFNLVELTLNEFNNPCKFLIREKQTDTLDVCLVAIPDDTKALVKTCWLCEKTDNHSTLDKNNYATS